MSASTNLCSEDQFRCPICLDVFTDPVTTSCGHNFCKNCIDEHWNQSTIFRCPNCNETCKNKPQLKINTLIREIVSQFRRESQQKSSSSSTEQQAAKPGEVPCDVCTGTKLKALKSCLVCLISYCETHLEPHLTIKRLKTHQLIEPVNNLEDQICMKHSKPLELFCKTDQTCVCMHCTYSDHKTHDVVPLREECEGKKAELTEMQQMIQSRRLKIEEISESVKKSKDAADREKAEGVQVFTALKKSAERRLKEFIKEIEDKQKTIEKQAEDSIKDLEQEISELMKRSSAVEQLLKSEDHLHLLQSFSSLKAAPPTKDWTEVRIRPPSYDGTVARAVAQLEETIRKQMKKKLMEAELKRVQQYAVDVTLDPDTANKWLILSDDGKQVYIGNVKKLRPNNPERFSGCFTVLGKQSFSSGKFYFEVQVKGKTEWDLGVVRESINRKRGGIMISPKVGFWALMLRNGNEYSAADRPAVSLHLQSDFEKVGVFVDYEEGLVSFYDVDAAALIYSFTGCSFNQKLFPFFSLCDDESRNFAPLVITPVNNN
ncbi:E3 ubiquitin-protein ligase TRIM21-like [Pholidichthys leucotaenia]